MSRKPYLYSDEDRIERLEAIAVRHPSKLLRVRRLQRQVERGGRDRQEAED